MTSKKQMIDDLNAAHHQTQKQLLILEKAQQTTRELYPTWSIKELLAHLTGWDEACNATLRSLTLGNAPATPASIGINSYNTITVKERESHSFSQVVQEWESTHQDFLQSIRELPEGVMDTDFIYPWGDSGNLLDMVAILVEHEQEHAEEIHRKVNP